MGANRATNGFLEALNGLFQTAKRKARGYRRFATIRTVIFLVAEKLIFSKINPIPPVNAHEIHQSHYFLNPPDGLAADRPHLRMALCRLREQRHHPAARSRRWSQTGEHYHLVRLGSPGPLQDAPRRAAHAPPVCRMPVDSRGDRHPLSIYVSLFLCHYYLLAPSKYPGRTPSHQLLPTKQSDRLSVTVRGTPVTDR